MKRLCSAILSLSLIAAMATAVSAEMRDGDIPVGGKTPPPEDAGFTSGGEIDTEAESDEAGSRSRSTGEAGELTVTVNGKKTTVDAQEIVAQVVQNEVGASFHTEAIKAQAVAAYTFIAHSNQSGGAPAVYLSKNVSDKVDNAVAEVIGEGIYYKGKLAFTPYHATSAGVTTSCESVWGGKIPYLVAVDSPEDQKVKGFRTEVTMTSDEVAERLSSKLGMEVSGDPSGWFEVLSYTDGGYVDEMAVLGNTKSASGSKLTGRLIRESVLNLRSANFEIAYDAGADEFHFTTYGYGHGVGMSQNGANAYANQGWDYIEILEYYYPGTTIE